MTVRLVLMAGVKNYETLIAFKVIGIHIALRENRSLVRNLHILLLTCVWNIKICMEKQAKSNVSKFSFYFISFYLRKL
jgi:hypothetical protein